MKSFDFKMQRRIVAFYVVGALGVAISGGLLILSLPGTREEHFVYHLAQHVLLVGLSASVIFVLLRRSMQLLHGAAEVLREQEDRTQTALQAVGDAVWEMPLDGKWQIDALDAGRLLGFTAEDFAGVLRDWRELVHPDDRDAMVARVADAANGKSTPEGFEFRLRTKSGDYRWFRARGSVQRFARGPRLIGTLTDISQLKAAQQELFAAEERYRLLFESNPSPTWIYDLETLRILAVNEEAVRHYGFTREEFLQKTVMDLRDADDAPEFLRETRAVHPRVRHSGPWRHRRASGDFIWVETVSREVMWQGRCARVVTARDVSEQRAALQELRMLHAALNATAAAWMITDVEGRIEWVNPAFTRLTGYPAEDVLGRRPSVLNSGVHSIEFFRKFWETILSGEVWEGDLQNRRKDGTLYQEHSVVAPVRSPDGSISHFVAMKHDITEQRQLELQLARAQRLESIGMLASGIAHDLNNVLTPILLSAEFLKEDIPDPKAQERVDVISQMAQRGAGIVRQVLTFARGEDGGEHRLLDASMVVKEIAQLARETLPRNIDVKVEGAGMGLLVRGDITQLHQALLNLVLNARDAMPTGGRLTLRLQAVEISEEDAPRHSLQAGLFAQISVEDTGCGIPPEVIERIFDPFFTTKPRGKGTGLGLSAVYGVARSHSGSVGVESTVGEGSTFTLWLPARETAACGSEPSAPVNGLQGGGRVVLVVDDEPQIRWIVGVVLRRHGFEVREASDGVEALALFNTRRPEAWALALVDMVMPRMGGEQLIPRLQALAPNLPIISTSGYVPEEVAQSLAQPLALPKPFTEADLLRVMSEALKKSDARSAS